jgi:hypothetical protein
MSKTAKRAVRTSCSALLSLVVVCGALLYVWLPQGQALAVTVTERTLPAVAVSARVNGLSPAAARAKAEIVYGKVSGPSGTLARGAVVFRCPRHHPIKRNFGRRGVFRKVLHRHRERCAFVLTADFGGHSYSAHGTLKLRPGHAYYINATLKDSRLFLGFPVETY